MSAKIAAMSSWYGAWKPYFHKTKSIRLNDYADHVSVRLCA